MELTEEEFEDLYGAWDPLTPAEARALLDPLQWWVVGGWALELATGVSRPHQDLDVRHLAPEIVLLHKSHLCRPKDDADLDAALPLLSSGARQWLAETVARCQPQSPWNARLRQGGLGRAEDGAEYGRSMAHGDTSQWQQFEVAGTVGWHKGDGDQLALVLHGGPGLSDYTAPLCEEVLAGGDGQLRVARYQQRGAPPSSQEGPITVAQLVADGIAVLDHLDAPNALLVGHSWGGHLAMHIAVAHPSRVAGLLLLDSLGALGDGGTGTMAAVIGGRIGETAVAEITALGDRTELSDDERGARELALMWPGYFKDPGAAPPMPPVTVSHLAGSVMVDAMRLLAEGALEAALPSLDVPSLHLIGSHSPIEPAANERTAALMRGAIVEVLDVGHFAWLEEPGSVAAATRRLRQHQAAQQ